MVSGSASDLPIVQELPESLDASTIFQKLASQPNCLWLDSSTRERGGRPDEDQPRADQPCGRYSFLSADPVTRVESFLGDESPWDRFEALVQSLPTSFRDDLPPFQGGVAGVIGYEAGASLESVGVAACHDLPTPVVSVGLYDWTIAIDHDTGKRWLISQGLDVGDDRQARVQRASERAEQVREQLLRPGEPANSGSAALSQEPSQVYPEYPTHIDGVTSNLTSRQFQRSVADIVARIRAGECFQVNLAQRLLRQADCTSPELYLRLREANPAPLSGYYDGGEFQVVSSSPESFLNVRGNRVETRPIKGTVPRSGDAIRDRQWAEELLASEKDHAENVMIVDLMRNDLSRVCEDDSVRVEKLCQIERYQFVQHLVSVVSGKLRGDQGVVDLLRACFPGGSVTGAPKIEAMKAIAELEPNPRGPYCGSMGYISCSGAADFNILIRTITAAGGYWQIPVGGGITARSEPAKEEAETWAKAEGMLRAVTTTPR